MRRSVWDVMSTAPRLRPGARYTDDEWRGYREGYDWALVVVLKVLFAAEERCAIVERTKRLERRRKRSNEQ